MPRMLFLLLLTSLAPLAAHAGEGSPWGSQRGQSAFENDYFTDPAFSDNESSDYLHDNRDRNEDRRRDDREIGNSFSGRSTKSLGEIVNDQLEPSSGR